MKQKSFPAYGRVKSFPHKQLSYLATEYLMEMVAETEE
jgi:hypothetical protein